MKIILRLFHIILPGPVILNCFGCCCLFFCCCCFTNVIYVFIFDCSGSLRRRQWHPTLVLLPEKSHGEEPGKAAVHGVLEESDMTE